MSAFRCSLAAKSTGEPNESGMDSPSRLASFGFELNNSRALVMLLARTAATSWRNGSVVIPRNVFVVLTGREARPKDLHFVE